MIPLKDDNPHSRTAVITISLIIINLIVFLVEMGQGSSIHAFVMRFGFVPVRLTADIPIYSKIGSFFSSIFLHGGWMHFLGNSLYLWIFGDNVEDRMGRGKFLVFYLLCGVFANMIHFIFNMNSALPAIGASGAIAGVLGAYFLMFPNAKVITLLPLFFFWQIIKVPAVFFLGFWFIYQLLFGLSSIGGQTGVAFWAHIGGFAGGVLLLKIYEKLDLIKPEIVKRW